MKGQQQRAAILLAGFLVLAVLVYLLEFRPQEEPEPKRVWDLKPALVVSLEVSEAGYETYRMERDEFGAWRIVAPSSGEADHKRLNLLVDELAALEFYRRFSLGEVSAEDIGLLAPIGTVTVGLQGGSEIVLEIGAPGPQPYTYYVRVGEVVYLCPSDPLERALKVVRFPPVPPPPTPEALHLRQRLLARGGVAPPDKGLLQLLDQSLRPAAPAGLPHDDVTQGALPLQQGLEV